jgi:Skp family chaperone for outer membrane proteins
MLMVSAIVFMALFFIALIFILRRVMTQNVLTATAHIEELNQEYETKEAELNKRLEEVKQKSEEILAKAQDEALKQKLQLIKEAEAQRDATLKQTRSQSEELIVQAQKSRDALLSEIDERISSEAVNKACELIQDILPEQFRLDVHSHWVGDLINSGLSGLKTLHIPEEVRDVKITSAFSLTDAQRKAIFFALKEALGKELKFSEEVSSKVVAGLIVTIGSLVLDGSLKNKIQERARSIQQPANG